MISHQEAAAVLLRWQPVLRLADWDIDLRIVEGPWRKSGDVKVDLDDRKAVVLLRATMAIDDLDEIVVHELVHLRLYALDQLTSGLLDEVFGADAAEPGRAFAEDRFMSELETTTEDLTKAILAASGRTRPLTFERLREEVDREVEGPTGPRGG